MFGSAIFIFTLFFFLYITVLSFVLCFICDCVVITQNFVTCSDACQSMWWAHRLNLLLCSGFSPSPAFSLSILQVCFYFRCIHHFIAGPLFWLYWFLRHILTQKHKPQEHIRWVELEYVDIVWWIMCCYGCTCLNTTITLNHMCYICLLHYMCPLSMDSDLLFVKWSTKSPLVIDLNLLTLLTWKFFTEHVNA